MFRTAPSSGGRLPTLPRIRDAFARRTVADELRPLADSGPDLGVVLRSLRTARGDRCQTELDPEVRALAVRLVATVTGRVCRDAGRRADVPGGKLAAVADHATDPRFLPDERAALAYAAALSGVGPDAPDDLLAELRRHFSERGIVELIAAVAMERGSNLSKGQFEVEAHGCRALPGPLPVVPGAA